MTKKNYIQPAFEVMMVNATYSVCSVSKFEFHTGGGSETIDPETGGL